MNVFFNVVIALAAWLGLFKTDLVTLLLTQPIGLTLDRLTGGDLIGFLAVFFVVTCIVALADHLSELRKRRISN